MFRKYLSAIYVILTIIILIYIYNINSIDKDIKTNLNSNTLKIISLDNEFIEIKEPIRFMENIQMTKAKAIKSKVYEKKYYGFKEKMLDNEEHSNAEMIEKSTRKILENNLSKDSIQITKEIKSVEKEFLSMGSIEINNKTYSVKKIESEIKFRDKIKALKLISKLNIYDLISIIRDGITKESIEKVKKLLKDKLTDKEYKEAKELTLKYMYLIED